MKKSKLLKLFTIILGAMMCFGFKETKAIEITSAFSNLTLNRASVAKASNDNLDQSKVIGIVKNRASGDSYQWNITTDGGGNNVWKVAQYSSLIATTPNWNVKDGMYCLNARRGFQSSGGEMTEKKGVYDIEIDMSNETNKERIGNYAGGNLVNNYNKIMWIADNTYIATGADNYQTLNAYKAFMKKAGITIESEPLYNLTEDDIEVVQQMAIWYFTNENDNVYHNDNLPNLYLNGHEISSMTFGTDKYGRAITGAKRAEKAKQLYTYFITEANKNANYTRKTPVIKITGENSIIKENTNDYTVGPYYLSGENIETAKSIEFSVNKKYTLLDASGNVVSENDFSKVMNSNFYLRIDKSEITTRTVVTIEATYLYDTRDLIFSTNTSDPEAVQPVIIIRNTEHEVPLRIEIPINITKVEVEKKWDDVNNQDGVRPSSIKVQLYRDGIAYRESVTLNASNNWSYTWNKLLSGYTYTVKELNSNNIAVENNESLNANYKATYAISGDKTTITNTHVPEVVSKTVVKKWDDANNQDGTRPNEIVVKLFKTVNNVKQQINGEIILNASNGWTYTWNNLPKYENGNLIKYTTEETVPNNYTVSYSDDTFTITNKYTPGTVNKTVTKAWDDNNNSDGIRPDSITVRLYANDVPVGEDVVLNMANSWTYTWTGLPEKENGVTINYTVKEIKIGDTVVENEVAAGYHIRYDVDANVTQITNIHEPNKTSKTVVKNWNDGDYVNRPKVIKIQLYKNGEQYGESITLTAGEDNIWQENELTYTWTDLPLKENGVEIKYTVKELDENGNVVENNQKYNSEYTTTYSEDTFTITNTHKSFDLALRKFITEISGTTYSREPVVDTSTIETTGTATYKHSKQPIAVQKGDVVAYKIRVYNEGEIAGYVNEITDHLPENLLPIIEGINGIDATKYQDEIKFNLDWGWTYTDNGKTVKTTKTSKDSSDTYSLMKGYETVEDTKLEAYVPGSDTLDYIEVQIKCLVTDSVVGDEYLTNIAEITKAEDINENIGDGKDSSLANVDYSNLSDYKNEEALSSNKDTYVPGQEDDDDFEKLIVKEFDLALRKFITKVNDTTYSREPVVDTSKLGTQGLNGKTITTATYNHSKEPVIVNTGDIVTYIIRIYNEGTLAGFANEITDDMPKGLEFLPNSSVNVSYKWKMLDKDGNETTDLSEAVMITTDYLSEADVANKINAVSLDENGNKVLDYKDVQVQFKVVATAKKLEDNIIKNVAQISADSDRDIDSIPNRDEKYDYETGDNEDDIDYEPVKLQYFDLALRKFITKVNKEDYNNRYPEVIFNEDGSITYKHTKDPVIVTTNDVVIYTIRIYNEGEKAGTATEIKDNIPEGLEFLPDDETNKQYNWKALDEDRNEVTDVTKAKYIVSDALKDDVIEGFVQENGQKVLSYKDVKVAFKVVAEGKTNSIIVNTAEISKDNGDDIDSVPDNNDEKEDDLDKEYIKVKYFDLALKKWVTETRVTVNGKTTTTKTGFTEDTEDMAKVDIVAKNLKKTTVKFVYSIKVINEGETAGYAYEVKDYIPNGLEFRQEDNKDWKQLKDGQVVTDKLKDTLLNPGESATVEIVLTWKNSTTNLGVKTNYAEISDDSGDDIDSTPDNFKKDEDDIDDAKVILSIKTAGARTYIWLTLISVTILAAGVWTIKKYVID